MRIAVDAMGGDHAPHNLVAGAKEALSAFSDVEVVLVGDREVLGRELGRFSCEDRLEVVHAPEVIGMEEAPASALQRKRGASIAVAVRLQKEGKIEAVVSAGNTGAVVVSSLLELGRIQGVSRPAIAAPLPTEEGVCVLLDAGANPTAKPKWLLQFAVMGSLYANHILGVPEPKVGLLSIGEESSKGHELIVETHMLLERSGLRFIGNVEGRDILRGVADVVVCDGFVGNVLLKFAESIMDFFSASLKGKVSKSPWRQLGALLVQPAIRELKQEMDYEEYGGAPLLGVNGVAVKCHGSSSPKAIRNAVGVARRMCLDRINEHIKENITKFNHGMV